MNSSEPVFCVSKKVSASNPAASQPSGESASVLSPVNESAGRSRHAASASAPSSSSAGPTTLNLTEATVRKRGKSAPVLSESSVRMSAR